MRSQADYLSVAELLSRGLSDCAVARATGVPRSTVRDWRREVSPRRRDAASTCERCGHPEHDPNQLPWPSYAYLRGMYLGDGDISRNRRTWRLRITLDLSWPCIMSECTDAMKAIFLQNSVSLYRAHLSKRCAVASVYSKQLVCLFPQHGGGRKHLRRIDLDDWQLEIVADQPRAFLRGLIHSDGCRSINTVRGCGATYRYPRYTFSNRSHDILALFTSTCDQLGIEWRRMNAHNISIAQRTSVARLDEFVGPKS
jgi:hypothetical protein